MKASMSTLVFGTLLVVLGLEGLDAQTPPGCRRGAVPLSGAAFAECARIAAEKYQDRSKAISDGYRPIGRDFPAMGEHWIRIGLVFDGVVDPTRPEVLNYVLVDGKPKLVGLGFAAPLLAGELAPEAPAGRDAWHDHSRTIEDETVLPHTDPAHGRVHAHEGAGPGARLAMLHTWLWAPNPDGVFATDNWGLAYVRLGLTVPAASTTESAKALSLLSGGVDFFAEQFAAQPRPAPLDRAKIDAILREARLKVEALMQVRRTSELTAVELSSLASIWNELERILLPPG
jgi:hypothetical protein